MRLPLLVKLLNSSTPQLKSNLLTLQLFNS
nr:MAG TPA: hypothetical protein [Caudoviricetes sp.]